MVDECLLRVRVSPQEVFRYAHLIWSDERVAHDVGVKACKAIELSYRKDPNKWLFKKKKTILGSLFYAIGLRFGYRKTREQIWSVIVGLDADGFDADGNWHMIGPKSISKYYRDWDDVLAEL